MGGSGVPIAEGERLPQVRLYVYEGGAPRAVSSAELFGERTVVAFALPGAFTPTCSSQHLPRYEELAPVFRAHGVDEVLCLSVNDPYVMHEWGLNQNLRAVKLVSDGNGDFARAMGMLLDDRDKGMGLRSRRYSMLVRKSRIEKLFIEPDEAGDPYTVSDADTLLDYLAPGCARPSRIAVFTKPGCPHCAHAMQRLRERGLRFEEIPLPDATRARVLWALARVSTAPQIFIDGRRIGGARELDEYLDAREHNPH